MTSRLPNPFDVAAEPEPPVIDDDPAEQLIGKTVAKRYRVTGILGRGGMGVVYAGEHLELERPVAIKVLPGQFTRDSEVLKRFEREARTASKIAHENIVVVYDYGRLESGEPYLVMERLTGRDLDVVLAEKRRLPPKEAIDVLVPLAAALDALHAQGIVHRDIKPSNVFFTASGTVKLVDFGLAVLRTKGERLTQSGNVVGTAEYMAPEAARGSLVDARGDVYSLATLAFELLTGQMPFSGAPVEVLIEKVSRAAPSLGSKSGLKFSDEVEDVIAQGLSRKPEQRQASCGELVTALAKAFERSPPLVTGPVPAARVRTGDTESQRPAASASSGQAPRVPGERRIAPWLGAGALALLLLVGGVASFTLWGDDSVPSSSTPTPVVPGPTPPATAPPALAPEALDREASEPETAEPARPDSPAPEASGPDARELAAAPRTGRARPRALESALAPAEARVPEPSPEAAPPVPEPDPEPERVAAQPVEEPAPAPAEGGAERSASLVREAQGALLRGELPRARELYREATGASPRNAAAWRGLGLVSERLHLGPEAVQAYERYLRVAPNAADADAIRERLSHLSGG